MLTSRNKPGSEEEQATPHQAREAIANYTRIVERRLKPDLDAASALRDKTFTEIAQFKQMSKALDVIKITQKANKDKDRAVKDESGTPVPALETRVNIGEEFYVRANIYNLEYVIVDVGLGVMVEMMPDEARCFVDERLLALEEHAKKHSVRISEIQAHLKSITECLTELRFAAGSTELFDGLSKAVEE